MLLLYFHWGCRCSDGAYPWSVDNDNGAGVLLDVSSLTSSRQNVGLQHSYAWWQLGFQVYFDVKIGDDAASCLHLEIAPDRRHRLKKKTKYITPKTSKLPKRLFFRSFWELKKTLRSFKSISGVVPEVGPRRSSSWALQSVRFRGGVGDLPREKPDQLG